MSEVFGLVYVEPLSVKISRFLKEKGFQAANYEGKALPPTYVVGLSAVGILFKDPARKPKRHFWGLIEGEEPRRIFLGVIYLGKAGGSRWYFKMRGKEHFEMVKKLGEDLAVEFKTKIVLTVEDEKEHGEWRLPPRPPYK